MYISELVMEVTRRCNMSCDHCMRGDPQKLDISKETIDRLLEGITGIGTITFSGGEPTLAVDKIQYVCQQIMKRKISLEGFYIVTNGVKASKKLMHVLIDLYAYIEYHDEGTSVLTMSKDQYHDAAIKDREKADQLYRALAFYKPDYLNHKIELPISEGRSLDNGLGMRDVSLESLVVETDDTGRPERVDSTIYVNALGDVCPSCELSFESQNEDKIGNVHENTLADIIDRESSKDISKAA